MANYEFCVDLGSAYTTIYKKSIGVVLREPTIALLDTSSKNPRVLKVGQDAERLYGKTADNEVFVHPIVEGVIKNTSLCQKILQDFINKVVQYKFVKPPVKVVVSLPVGLSEEEYEDYKRVFYAIGFAKVDFVYNAILSSLADSTFFNVGKAGMLVNIGAGKTEIASIINGKIINACSLNVGGNSVDKSIAEYLSQTQNISVSENSVTKLKNEIGSLYETDKSNMEIFVQDNKTNLQVSSIIHARDILKPIYDNYFKILQTIQVFYNGCSAEVAQDIQNEGIVFCGGGSQITGLEYFFKRILNLSIFVLDNPEISAVMGSEKLMCDSNLLQKIVEEN